MRAFANDLSGSGGLSKITVDIKEVENDLDTIKERKNYFNSKKSTFKSNLYGASKYSPLSKCLVDIHNIFEDIAINLKSVGKYVDDYLDDMKKLEKKYNNSSKINIYKLPEDYLFQFVHDYKQQEKEFKLEHVTNDLESMGINSIDIDRYTKGEISFEELMSEIMNDPEKKKSFYQSNYLKSLKEQGVDIDANSIEEMDIKIGEFDTQIAELEKKVEDSIHEKMLYSILNNMKEKGYDLEVAINEPLYYQLEDGTIVDERPIDGEFTPVLFKDYFSENELEELKNVLNKEGKKTYTWTGTDEQISLLDKYSLGFDDLESNQEKLTNIQNQRYEYIYFKDYIVNNVDFYIENYEKYQTQGDFSINSQYAKSSIVSDIAKVIDSPNFIENGRTSPTYYVDGIDEEAKFLSYILNENASIYVGNDDLNNYQFVEVASRDNLIKNISDYNSVITDEEKEIFNYVYNTEGSEAAIDYLNNLLKVFDSRWYDERLVSDQNFATEHPVIASLYSVFGTPIEGIRAFNNSLSSLVTGNDILRKSVYGMGDVYRQTVGYNLDTNEDVWNGWSFIYNTGMSMADSLLLTAATIATGGGSAITTTMLSAGLMGSRAYGSALSDALDRGLTDGQAVLFAATSAVVETAMESYSVGHLINLESKLGKVTSDLVRNATSNIENETLANIAGKTLYLFAGAISQGFAEGEEEVCTEILNHVADQLISGDLSSYNLSILNYMNEGKTEEEARIQANKDFGSQIWQAFEGGLASGICFGIGGSIVSSHNVTNFANVLVENNKFDGNKSQAWAEGIILNQILSEEGISLKDVLERGDVDLVVNADGKTLSDIFTTRMENGSDSYRGFLQKILDDLKESLKISISGIDVDEKLTVNNARTSEMDLLKSIINDETTDINRKIDLLKSQIENITQEANKNGRFSIFNTSVVKKYLNENHDFDSFVEYIELITGWDEVCNIPYDVGMMLDQLSLASTVLIHRTNVDIKGTNGIEGNNSLYSIMTDGLANYGHTNSSGAELDSHPPLVLTTTPMSAGQLSGFINLLASYKNNDVTIILDIPSTLVNQDGYVLDESYYDKIYDTSFMPPRIKPEFIKGVIVKNESGLDSFYTREQIIEMHNDNSFSNTERVLNINSSTAEVLKVSELDMDNIGDISDRHAFNWNQSYEGFDYVIKPNTNLQQVINEINEHNDGSNILIEIPNINELTIELLENIPDNVQIRIFEKTTESLLTQNDGGSMIAYLKKLSYTNTELLEIMTEINKIKSGINESWNQYQIAEYVYNYLRDNIRYEGNPGGIGIREKQYVGLLCLTKKEGTCLSYANAYNIILNSLGIETYQVSGRLNRTGKHAYNIVKIDNNLFVVDPVRELLDNAKEKYPGTGFGVVDLSQYNAQNYLDMFNSINSNNYDFKGQLNNLTNDSITESLVNLIDNGDIINKIVSNNSKVFEYSGILIELLNNPDVLSNPKLKQFYDYINSIIPTEINRVINTNDISINGFGFVETALLTGNFDNNVYKFLINNHFNFNNSGNLLINLINNGLVEPKNNDEFNIFISIIDKDKSIADKESKVKELIKKYDGIYTVSNLNVSAANTILKEKLISWFKTDMINKLAKYYSKYSILSESELISKLNDSLILETEEEFERHGQDSNVKGFNDGINSYIKVRIVGTEGTIVHESIHQISNIGEVPITLDMENIISKLGIDISNCSKVNIGGVHYMFWNNEIHEWINKFVGVNECITEFLKLKLLKEVGIKNQIGYSFAINEFSTFIKLGILDEDMIEKAYFTNDISLIANHLASVLNINHTEVNKIFDAFDLAISDFEDERMIGINYLRKVSNDYMVKLELQGVDIVSTIKVQETIDSTSKVIPVSDLLKILKEDNAYEDFQNNKLVIDRKYYVLAYQQLLKLVNKTDNIIALTEDEINKIKDIVNNYTTGDTDYDINIRPVNKNGGKSDFYKGFSSVEDLYDTVSLTKIEPINDDVVLEEVVNEDEDLAKTAPLPITETIHAIQFTSKEDIATYFGDARLYLSNVVLSKSKELGIDFNEYQKLKSGISTGKESVIQECLRYLTEEEIKKYYELLNNSDLPVQKWIESLNEYEKTIIQLYARNYFSMESYEAEALGYDTNGESYVSIIDLMRAGLSEGSPELDSVIEKFGVLEKEIVTYHLTDVDTFTSQFGKIDLNDLSSLIGKKYKDKGYISTSLLETSVQSNNRYANTEVLFKVKVPTDANYGAYIEPLAGSGYSRMEFLIKKNSTSIIENAYVDEKGRVVIEMTLMTEPNVETLYNIPPTLIVKKDEDSTEAVVPISDLIDIIKNDNIYELFQQNKLRFNKKIYAIAIKQLMDEIDKNGYDFDFNIKDLNRIYDIVQIEKQVRANIQLKKEILAKASQYDNLFQKARVLYLELAKKLHYDYNYGMGKNENYKDSVYGKYMSFEDLEDSSRVICKGWAELYREILIDAGFDSSKIQVVAASQGRSHRWIQIMFDSGVIVADATEFINGSIDLAASKANLPTTGFKFLSKSEIGSRLSKKGGSVEYPSVLADNKLTHDEWLFELDKSIGYASESGYLNISMKKAKALFSNTDLYKKLFGEKLFKENMKSLIELDIPKGADGYEVYTYYKKVIKLLFSENDANKIGLHTDYFIEDGKIYPLFEMSYSEDGEMKYLLFSEKTGKILLGVEDYNNFYDSLEIVER